MLLFANRREAGKALAARLRRRDYVDPVILALPRGGVPVGAEIARALAAPLDLVMVRKIGVPSHPELALAAVVDGDRPDLVVNEDVRRMAGVDDETLRQAEKRELAEIGRRRALYGKGHARPPVEDATVIVVDDGIATGATVRAALKALRRRGPRRLVLAVPVAPAETVRDLAGEVDEIVCLDTPEPFFAISLSYRDFTQVSDDEVIALLAGSRRDGDPTG